MTSRKIVEDLLELNNRTHFFDGLKEKSNEKFKPFWDNWETIIVEVFEDLDCGINWNEPRYSFTDDVLTLKAQAHWYTKENEECSLEIDINYNKQFKTMQCEIKQKIEPVFEDKSIYSSTNSAEIQIYNGFSESTYAVQKFFIKSGKVF